MFALQAFSEAANISVDEVIEISEGGYDWTATNESGETCLHMLLQWTDLDFDVILRVVELYPAATNVCCMKGNLPLHLYCSHDPSNSDSDVLEALLAAFPEAANIRNRPTKNFLRPLLPIEIAMRCKNDETFDYLWQRASEHTRQDLRSQWTASQIRGDLKCRYQNNDTALHHVIWAGKVSEHVLFVLLSYLEAVWCLNGDYCCPLDLALLHGCTSERVVRALLREMTQSAQPQIDAQGQCAPKNMRYRYCPRLGAEVSSSRRDKILCRRELQLWAELNWRARRMGMLVAHRLFDGMHAVLLSRIALFL